MSATGEGSNAVADTGDGGGDPTRRDFIHVAAGSAAAFGLAAAMWPFVRQLGPAADTLALSSADVDVGKVVLGAEIRLLIGGKPFFVRHRTAGEIASARAVDVPSLRDPQTDDDRLRPGTDGKLKPQYLIVSGVCTHLGCVPVGPAQGAVGDFGGWYCPCHGSHYDTSGRIRRGPAPQNLEVPTYRYLSDTVVRISL